MFANFNINEYPTVGSFVSALDRAVKEWERSSSDSSKSEVPLDKFLGLSAYECNRWQITSAEELYDLLCNREKIKPEIGKTIYVFDPVGYSIEEMTINRIYLNYCIAVNSSGEEKKIHNMFFENRVFISYSDAQKARETAAYYEIRKGLKNYVAHFYGIYNSKLSIFDGLNFLEEYSSKDTLNLTEIKEELAGWFENPEASVETLMSKIKTHLM